MLTIKTWRDPYDSGFSPTRPKEIILDEGITILVGCNGAGKSTLLKNIKSEMKKEKIPCHLYDNLNSGGSSSISEALFYGDSSLGASLWTSSEGEAIKINLGELSNKIKKFLREGFFDTKANRIARIFKDELENITSNIRVLLFDAIDSGLSVDSIVEVKEFFNLILNDAKEVGVEIYIIISANEYELARKSNCFDVNNGKYIQFKDYEEYRSFIIKNREKKERRIKRQEEWYKKQREKEEKEKQKREKEYGPLIKEIKEKAKEENRELTWEESNRIRDYESMIEYGHY